LDDLCSILHLLGKTSKYNPEFHNLSLFDKPSLLDEFKDYALQDSVAFKNIFIYKYILAFNYVKILT